MTVVKCGKGGKGLADGSFMPLPYLLLALGVIGSVVADSTLNFSASGYGEFSNVQRTTNPGSQLNLGTVSGFDYRYLVGPHRLNSRYRLTLNSQIDEDISTASQITGNSDYFYDPAGGRMDVSAAHTVRSINIDSAFGLGPEFYTTQQGFTLAGGLNFYPGSVSQLRLSTETGRAFYEDEELNGRSLSAEAAYSRQLNAQASLTSSVSRVKTWEGTPLQISEIDNGQIALSNGLDNGQIELALGITQVNTDTRKTERTTGRVNRAWQTDAGETRLSYDRAVHSTLLELTRKVPAVTGSGTEEDVIRIQSLSLRDAVTARLQSQRLCRRCRVDLLAQVAHREELYTDARSFDYRAEAGFTMRLNSLLESSLLYDWEGEAPEFEGPIVDQIHRLRFRWERQLSDSAELTLEANQAWVRGVNDSERFSLRLTFTQNWGPAID